MGDPSPQNLILRGLPMIPDPAVPGRGLWQTSWVSMGNVCRPGKLLLRRVSGTFDVSASAIPYPSSYGGTNQRPMDPNPALSGSRTGLTLEGPFVEYTVAAGAKEFSRSPFRQGRPDNYASIRGVHEPAARTFLFDASQPRPICLPYAGSLRLLTQYPGTWVYQYAIVEFDTHEQVSPIDSEVTLSLVLQADTAGDAALKNREAGIPQGAHSLTYRDSHTTDTVWPTITVQTDDTAKAGTATPAGKAYTNLVLTDAFAQSSQFYGRVGLGNASGVRIDGVPSAPGNAGFGVLTFHISLV